MCDWHVYNKLLLTYLLTGPDNQKQSNTILHTPETQTQTSWDKTFFRISLYTCFVHCHMTGHGVRGQIISNIFTYNSQPVSNFAGLMSTPMMRAAPAFWQPSRAARPTAPRPNTAQVEPGSTFAVFSAAPYPVEIPHPSKHTLSSPAALSTYSKIQSTQHMAHTSPFSSRYIST